MANIAVLVPRVEMMEQANAAARKMNINLFQCRVIQTHEAVQEARSAVAEGANIIVARGVQAAMIKNETNIPLVEISITGQELGLLVRKAAKLTDKARPHIGLIGFRNNYSNTDHFEELYDIRLSTYFIDEIEQIQKMVLQAQADGVDVIIGGDHSMRYAESYGIPGVFNESWEESMQNALQIAEKVANAIDVERQSDSHIDTILDTSFDGMIRVNTKLRITATNRVVRETFSLKENDLQGMLITDLMPELTQEFIENVISGDEAQVSTSVQFGDMQLMVTASAVEFNGAIAGCIFSFHRMGSISPKSKSMLHNMYLNGFVANRNFGYILRASKRMNLAVELAKVYALSRSPVLIYGETGTEKEIFAQAIHNGSARRNQPYVSISCFEASEEKLAALLFGTEGEEGGQNGALISANFGTLHIADIHNLSPQCQYRLVKLLEHRALIRNDINRVMNIDVRIIASLERDLAVYVNRGSFRRDLYYSLQSLVLNIPPLRDNKDDLERLFRQYFKKYMDLYSKYIVVTDNAVKKICDYEWSGNLLQLDRFCEALVLTAKRRTLDEGYIGNTLMELYPAVESKAEERVEIYKYPEALKIARLLEKHGGNRKAVAEELGISTTTLWRHMKKYGVEEQYR